MVAAPPAPRPTPLPLLAEPDPPGGDRRSYCPGWRSSRAGWTRRHSDDDYGALVQHTIARYLTAPVQRKHLASEIGVSDRCVQAWLRAESWSAYAAPILQRFATLGIGTTRGRWNHGTTAGRRPEQIAAASQRLMRRAADAVAGRPLTLEQRDRLVADLRLLAVGGT